MAQSTAAVAAPPEPVSNTVLIYAWCDACGRQERMLTPRQAAAHGAVSPRTIYRWATQQKIHTVKSAEEMLLICYQSLFGAQPDLRAAAPSVPKEDESNLFVPSSLLKDAV